MKANPDFLLELNCGYKVVAGADEVGRGPLSGPVVAAAVIFRDFSQEIPVIIRDSKQMTAHQRSLAADWIRKNTVWAIAESSPAEIDEINILWASMLAMTRAVQGLSLVPDFCLVDGNRVPKDISGQAVIKGDAKSLSIAAASILAKEYRDALMCDLGTEYPEYGWEQNSGYPTKAHLQAIKKYGITKHHRKSFKPVKERIENGTTSD